MNRPVLTTIAALCILTLDLDITCRAAADSKLAESTKARKEKAKENLKKAGVTAESIETDDLLVYSTLSAEKTKALGTPLQKAYDSAWKTLGLDTKSPPWEGKLTVYVFAEPRKYKSYVLEVLKQPTKNRESHRRLLRDDEPSLLISVSGDGATTESCAVLASTVLQAKVGTTANDVIPDWIINGFGNVVAMRMDNAKAAAHRTKVRALYAKNNGNFTPKKIWDGDDFADRDIVTTNFVDFLVNGPDSDGFLKFVNAVKADQNGTFPVDAAMTAAGWKADALEVGWRRWATATK